MTIWYVAAGTNGDGSESAPWPTISKALEVARPGDTIRVRGGAYREIVALDGENVTLEAEPGHHPVIDGGYGTHLFGAEGFTGKSGRQITAGQLPYPSEANRKRGKWPLAAAQGFLVRMGGKGNVLRGLSIVNVCGRALVVGGENNAAEDCPIDFAYGGSVFMPGTNGRLSRCAITRSSMKEFDPTRDGRENEDGEANSARVQTSVIIKGEGNVMEDCVVAYCYGEGIAAAKEAERVTIRRCKVNTTAHWGIGVNHASDVLIDGCILAWDEMLLGQMGRDKPGDLLVISAEREDMAWVNANIRVTNCLFIGGDQQLLIASGGSGRRVQLTNCYFGYNTFVGGPTTDTSVFFGAISDKPHKRVLFENNILLRHPAGRRVGSAESGAREVVFRHNLSNEPLPGVMAGTNSIVVAPAAAVLAAPAPVTGGVFDYKSDTIPDGRPNLALAAFAPAAGSPVVGAASDGSAAGGITPPRVEFDIAGRARTAANAIGALAVAAAEEPPSEPPPPDEPPEEPGADWEALLGQAVAVGEHLATLGQALTTTRETAAAVQAALGNAQVTTVAAQEALTGAAAALGELLLALDGYRQE